jgi:hypothetical protein
MEGMWTVLIAAAIFLAMGILFYFVMRGYVKETYGKKWLTLWGNKLYFWQSLLFVSMASTALLLFILRWVDVLTF